MTADDLLTNGFYEFNSSLASDRWDRGFQHRVRDDRGTRYFVQVYFWQHGKHYDFNASNGWEADITYNDGVAANPRLAAIKVHAYAGVAEWSADDVKRWAADLWERLQPAYYELDEPA